MVAAKHSAGMTDDGSGLVSYCGGPSSYRIHTLMMIAFITFNSSLVPLIEGPYSSNPWELEFSNFGPNWTDDLGINSPLLWPTEPRLHARSSLKSVSRAHTISDPSSVVLAPRFAATMGHYLRKMEDPREVFFLTIYLAEPLYWASQEGLSRFATSMLVVHFSNFLSFFLGWRMPNLTTRKYSSNIMWFQE